MGFQATVDEKQGKLLILKKGKLLGYYSLDFLRKKALENWKRSYTGPCRNEENPRA